MSGHNTVTYLFCTVCGTIASLISSHAEKIEVAVIVAIFGAAASFTTTVFLKAIKSYIVKKIKNNKPK